MLVDNFKCSSCEDDPCKGEGPVVLGCGHLYCKECCVPTQSDGSVEGETSNGLFLCGICKTYSRGIPNVSLPLKEFLCELEKTNEVNEDLLQCSICLEVLWKPTVLQCGHWICFWCLERTFSRTNNCPLCRYDLIIRPKEFTVLQNFIQKYIPSSENRAEDPDVISLEEEIQKKFDDKDITQKKHLQSVIPTLFRNINTELKDYDWIVLGCDGCGVFPIIGPQVYRCKDCLEIIGYDLCEDCYKYHSSNATSIAGEGRYSQQHDPVTHEFLKVTPSQLFDELKKHNPDVPDTCAFQ